MAKLNITERQRIEFMKAAKQYADEVRASQPVLPHYQRLARGTPPTIAELTIRVLQARTTN